MWMMPFSPKIIGSPILPSGRCGALIGCSTRRSGVHVFAAITSVMIVSLKMSKRLARLNRLWLKARSAQAEAQPAENMGPSSSSLLFSTKNSKKCHSAILGSVP